MATPTEGAGGAVGRTKGGAGRRRGNALLYAKRQRSGEKRVKQIQTASRTVAIGIVLLIILASVLQPLLPWLFAIFVFACILHVVLREP